MSNYISAFSFFVHCYQCNQQSSACSYDCCDRPCHICRVTCFRNLFYLRSGRCSFLSRSSCSLRRSGRLRRCSRILLILDHEDFFVCTCDRRNISFKWNLIYRICYFLSILVLSQISKYMSPACIL